MATLVLTRGLPGSGKTFFALSWVAAAPQQRARINRDDLRTMCHGGQETVPGDDGTPRPVSWQEAQITTAQLAAVLALLATGIDVIVDDTNLSPRTMQMWQTAAAETGHTLEVVDFTTVPLEVCLRQNNYRTGTPAYVPRTVIKSMHQRYLAPKVEP